nr:hypothetical protein [Chroomonas debatzensis]
MNGLELIFTQVGLKVHGKLRNVTKEPLLLDYLKRDFKVYLLLLILEEFKSILINLKYYSYLKIGITYKLDRLLQLMIFKVRGKLNRLPMFAAKKIHYDYSKIHWLVTSLENEDKELIKVLISTDLWIKKETLTSEAGEFSPLLIMAILENFLLKLSDIIIYLLLVQTDLELEIVTFESKQYLEILTTQRNNIYWQTYIKEIFLRPRHIYQHVYHLKIITTHGICNKIVYLPTCRLKDKQDLSKIQSLILLYIELINFISPKLETVKFVIVRFFSQAFRKAFSL